MLVVTVDTDNQSPATTWRSIILGIGFFLNNVFVGVRQCACVFLFDCYPVDRRPASQPTNRRANQTDRQLGDHPAVNNPANPLSPSIK